MLHNVHKRRFRVTGSWFAFLFVASSCFVRPVPVRAQSAATTDERLKAVERERDELKKRNGVLELRLKQLQATVNKEISDALRPAQDELVAAPPTPHPPPESPAGTAPTTPATNSTGIPYWRATAAVYPRFGGIPPALQSPVDVIGLAVAYQDALSEFQKTRRPKESKDGRSIGDVDPAERKVRLLRSITMTLRDQAAAEVDRVRKLAAVHAVPVVDLRNLDAKMKILDLILAQDPDAGPMPAQSTNEKPTRPVKTD